MYPDQITELTDAHGDVRARKRVSSTIYDSLPFSQAIPSAGRVALHCSSVTTEFVRVGRRNYRVRRLWRGTTSAVTGTGTSVVQWRSLAVAQRIMCSAKKGNQVYGDFARNGISKPPRESKASTSHCDLSDTSFKRMRNDWRYFSGRSLGRCTSGCRRDCTHGLDVFEIQSVGAIKSELTKIPGPSGAAEAMP